MEKTILTRKHAIIQLSLVLLLVLFAFVFAFTQAVELPAFAEGEDDADLAERYAFTLDRDGYTEGGAFIRVKSVEEYPVFKLTFVDQTDLEGKRFWFGVSESASMDDVDVWTPVHHYENGVGEVDTFTLTHNVAEENGGIYDKYLFFRAGMSEAGPFYYGQEKVNLRLDNNATDDAYRIDSIGATYEKNGIAVSYDLTADSKLWVSSPITLRVTNNGGRYDNAKFYYQLEGVDANGNPYEPQPFDKKSITEEGSSISTYYGEAIVPHPDLGIESYEGKITVFSTSFASLPDSERVEPVDSLKSQEFNLYYDGAQPSFTVEALCDGVPHANVNWAQGDITYVVHNKQVASGAQYYCEILADNKSELYEIQQQGEEYAFTVSREGVTYVTFSAVSGSGVRYQAQQITAYIDKTAPKLSVQAIDATNAEIKSMGTVAGSNYRVGYASDEVLFTLTNEAIQQTGNTIKYYFSEDGVEYNLLAETNGNYQVRVENGDTNKIIDKTYYFKITSASGYEMVETFTLSVLDSDYSVEMDVEDVEKLQNGAGWLNDKVNVTFRLPSVLGIANEYEIRGMVTGVPDTNKKLVPVTEIVVDGVIIYEVQIDENLNNTSYTFEISDKASNKATVGIVNGVKGEALKTTQLKLDLVTPSANLVATIYGSSIELSETDWSAEQVVLTITPEALISGVNCYPVINGIQSNVAMQAVGGVFKQTISEGGLYEYCLISGAGNKQEVSYQINIDARKEEDITFDGLKVSTIGKDGSIIEEDIDVSYPGLKIANNVKVEFLTNLNYLPYTDVEAKHFNFYYTTFTGNRPTVSKDEYKLYTPKDGADPFSFMIELSEEEGEGSLKYAFYLRSMAQSASGAIVETDVKFFSVDFDIRVFHIEVTYSSESTSDQWVGNAPRFTLSLHPDDQGKGITIKAFQYKLADGQWITIDGYSQGQNSIDFDFAGVEYKIDPVDYLYSLNPDNTFKSYNGPISFRAINTAGHASPEGEYNVKVDTSVPNPLYAVSQESGEKVYSNDANRFYTIYSNKKVTYSQTGVNVDSVYGQKAPITYYYRQIISTDPIKEGDSKIDQLFDSSVWQVLYKETELVSGQYYWLVAYNGIRTSAAYKVNIRVEGSAPTASLLGGNVGSVGGVYEYNWTQDRAQMQFAITSESNVYIWYSLNGGDWEKVSSTQVEVEAGRITYHNVAFVAPPANGAPIEEDFVIVGNVKATVRFKITNLAGSSFEVKDSVIIRIDNESPVFDVKFSTASIGDISEDDLSAYFNETINIKIEHKAENPGGVEYTYKVKGNSNYEKMAGDYITSDEILGFSGNGTLELTIRAQAKASLKIYEKSFVIYIDKIAPEFKLQGEVCKKNPTTNQNEPTGKKIESGTWVNADEIRISRIIDSSLPTPISGVTYTIATTTEPVKIWEIGTPYSVKEESTIYVTATSGSGLVVKKEFQVNIDNVPPAINAGPISNPGENQVDLNVYFVDQEIRFVESRLKSAMYNGFPITSGYIIATDTIDNSEAAKGIVHIVIEDLAGNKTELRFRMVEFGAKIDGIEYGRSVNTITLSEEDKALLAEFEIAFENARSSSSLRESRVKYFEDLIGRLKDRVATLEKQVADYQAYLERVNNTSSFTLEHDFEEMESYMAHFVSPDPLVLYPTWQQEKIREGDYNNYYIKLESEYNKLNAHMAVVRDVQKQVIALPATNIVEEKDYQSVIRVYNAYQSLSNDQKSKFKYTLLQKLLELKRICEVYLLQDEDKGISIMGDHLVGEAVGLMLEVVAYEPTTELFINAQKTLYETVSEGNPRKIISINKLGLTGYGSQYDTGEITITLPIPSEGEINYTEYVYFAVYRLSTDGTLSPVKDVMRSRDGKSVYFNSTQLDTYVLATTANVVVREEPEKIYGSVANIEIDATLLTYITFAVIAMFVVFVVIVLLVAIRRRTFLRAYNRDHKNALQRRGITRIPKGNAPPISNPARPEERVGDTRATYYYGKRRR